MEFFARSALVVRWSYNCLAMILRCSHDNPTIMTIKPGKHDCRTTITNASYDHRASVSRNRGSVGSIIIFVAFNMSTLRKKMQNNLQAMLQKEKRTRMQLYYLHATKSFLQTFMIVTRSNGGNAQQGISSTTHFILGCTFQMCIWKRKDGIENHEFIFNSYDALTIIVRHSHECLAIKSSLF